MRKVFENGVRLLNEYAEKNGIQSLVLGVSGGLDSAVVAGFCHESGITTYGCLLPCYSSVSSLVLGEKVIDKFYLIRRYHDLSRILDAVLKEEEFVDPEDLISVGNIKARLRMIYLYNMARRKNGMVMSTDNLSELLMGFWTLHGDVGDFGIIQNLWKGTEVAELAKYIGVPQEIIAARPTDDLGINPLGDEGQLGASYPVLDEIMQKLFSCGFRTDGGMDQLEGLVGLERSLAERCLKTHHKRVNPVNLTRKELGLDGH